MENIKSLLYVSLTGMTDSLTAVQAIKEYRNNEKAVNDCEKMVFTDTGIAIADYKYERQLYGIAHDKIRNEVTLLYFIKSDVGYDNFILNTNYIAEQWRNNNFGKNTIVNSSWNISNEWIVLTDRIQYTEITFNCVEINEIA